MTEKGEFRLFNFSGGLNTRDSAVLIRNSESPDMQNIILDETGPLQIRPGTAKFLDSPLNEGPLTSLYEYVDSNGGVHLLAFSEDTLKVRSGGSWSNLKTGLPVGSRVEFITNTVDGKCYIATGEGYYSFDGSNFEEVSEYSPTDDEVVEFGVNQMPANPWIIIFHKSRIWVVDKDSPDTIAFCGHDIEGTIKYNYFPANYRIGVSSKRGEDITGVTTFRDRIYLFTKNTIWTIYGGEPEDFMLVQELNSIGSVAHRSIVEISNNLFFLGNDGVYMYDGTTPHSISGKIPTYIDKIDKSKRKDSIAVKKGSSYLLAVPEENNNDLILQFNTEIISELYEEHGLSLNAWMVHRGFSPLDFFENREGELLFGCSDGYVREYGKGNTDDGERIEAYYVTKALSFEDPEKNKRIRRVHVVFEKADQDLIINMRREFGDWESLAMIDMWKFGEGTLIRREDLIPPINELFNFIQLRFENGGGGSFKIHGLIIHFVKRGIRV